MMTLIEYARNLRAVIEEMTATASDAVVSKAPAACPKLKQDGSLVRAGTKINWNGVVKKAGSDLWDTELNDPDHAPTLWEDLLYKDGYRIIPETITVTGAFSDGEKGWWKGQLWESTANNNVYNPDQYPENWRLIG